MTSAAIRRYSAGDSSSAVFLANSFLASFRLNSYLSSGHLPWSTSGHFDRKWLAEFFAYSLTVPTSRLIGLGSPLRGTWHHWSASSANGADSLRAERVPCQPRWPGARGRAGIF